MDAEKVIVELLVKSDQFDRQAVQSSTAFDASMKRIETSAKGAETAVARSSDARIAAIRKESAQISSAARILGTQLNDIGGMLNGPSSPFVVPVKQAPAVSRAMMFMQSGAAALGGVIGGVLTSAVIAYVASLAEMILKSDDATDRIDELVEKLKLNAQQARDSEAAHQLFDKSLEGVRKAADDAEKAIAALKNQQKSQEEQTVESIRKALDHATAIRVETAALIAAAKAANERFAGSLASADPRFASQFQVSSSRIAELEKQLNDANVEAARLEKSLTQALSFRTVQESGRSAEERINAIYDSRIEAARQEATLKAEAARKAGDHAKAERLVGAELKKQTDELNKQRQIDLANARKRPPSTRPDRQIGASLTAEQARSIVNAQFGAGTVTSGRRSAEHNKNVGGVPNSFHLTGNAIDVAKRPGVTLNKITELLRRQGVTIAQGLDEGDHYHVAWRNARSEAEKLAQAQARAALEAERREQAFNSEKGNLDQQVIDARQALIVSSEEIAKLELEAIEKSRVQYNEKLASLVEQNRISGGIKGLTAKEAEELQKLNDERAKLRAELVKRREEQRTFRLREAEAQRKVDNQAADISTERELLESRAGLATTARQRHDLEQRLITLAFDEERLQLQATIAGAERLRIELERLETLRALSDEEKAALLRAQDQARVAQDRLNTQGEREANAQAGNDQANAGPLQSFFGDIPGTADQINEALESVAAGGLATFTDALTDAIVNWRGFGDVALQTLRSVAAGIIRLGIQQLLLHTIGKSLGTTAVAATSAQAGATAAAWAPAAAAASLATLGANAGPAAAALASTHALSAALSVPKGFRSGGYTGNIPVDQAAGIVHGREFVFDADATRRIGPSNLEAIRRGVTPNNSPAVAPRGAGGGASFSPEAIAQLRGIIGEAIQAMPEIGVYPTLDPGEVLERGLASKRGSRAFIAHLGNNRGAANGALAG